MDGGIFGFLGLIASHRGAVEYDWRTRFGVGLAAVGVTMTLAEASRLAAILSLDPSSAAFAAVAGWTHPVSREALILMDLFDIDLAVAMAGKKNARPKPHPLRPTKPDERSVKKHGDVAGRSRDEVLAILRPNKAPV